MSNRKSAKEVKRGSGSWNCRSIMQCFSSREQMKVEDMLKLSDSQDDVQPRPDTLNIEEAESSLRESSGLNFEVGFSCIPFLNVDCALFVELLHSLGLCHFSG